VQRPVILVVGSLHYDIMVEAAHLPRKDETAVGSRWYPKFGGKGGNQAISIAKTGIAARMYGAIGQDDFGRFLREALRAGGVEDRFVCEVAEAGSGMSVAIMDAAGEYAATIVSGANLLMSDSDLQNDALWDNVRMLVLQNEVPEAINHSAALQARRRGIRTLLNAAPSRPLSAAFSALVDILVVNAVEAEMMGADPVCCLHSATAAARKLASQFSSVIVTAGSLGLAAWTDTDDALTIPAKLVKAVSSHGAGDAFIGTFASRLVQGDTFELACHAASSAAARHVGNLPDSYLF
jgi:ribokinase